MIDVPADMDSVIKRWYPSGVDSIAAGRRAAPAGIFVTGTPGSGVTTVEAQIDAMSGSPLERADSVEAAAVVLFVLDASAPLGRRALADLAPLLESTTVAIVVNKIDVHRDWRDVRRAVSESVNVYVPRSVDVSFWPVSAKLAQRSRMAADSQVQSTLRAESGMDELVHFLVTALAQPDRALRERKYNATVHAAAMAARSEIVSKARTVTSATASARLRGERARLFDARDTARTQRAATLRSRIQLVRSESIHDINESLRDFAAAARESVDTAGRAESKHLPDHIGERLRLCAAGVDTRLADRLRSIDTDLELTALPAVAPALTVECSSSPPPPRRRGLEDKMMALVGASAGIGLGRIVVSPLSLVPAIAIAIIPISLLLGVVCAWWLVGSRRLVADRAHLRTWVADAAGAAKSELERGVVARILASEAAFAHAAQDTGRSASVAELELGRVENEIRAVAEYRSTILAACDRDLSALERGLEKFGVFGRAEPAASPVRLNM